MNLCDDIAAARREQGLSQSALAHRVNADRGAIARLEIGIGSVALLLQVLAALSIRLGGIAKGLTLIEQLHNARERRNWSHTDLATRSGLDVRTVRSVEHGEGSIASIARVLGVLAPNAARSVAKISYWNYDKAEAAERDARFTPQHLLDGIVTSCGPIALDPCSHPASPVTAEMRIQLPECGLTADWSTDGLAYVNPPFSAMSNWLNKAMDEWDAGKVGSLIFMLPTARFDTRAFAERAARQATTLILSKRPTFGSIDPNLKYPIPFAIALAFLGVREQQIEHFRRLVPSMRMEPQLGLCPSG